MSSTCPTSIERFDGLMQYLVKAFVSRTSWDILGPCVAGPKIPTAVFPPLRGKANSIAVPSTYALPIGSSGFRRSISFFKAS